MTANSPRSGPFFVLDAERCVGCGACVLACRLENQWSEDEDWRRVLAFNQHRHPGGPTYYLSLACHHCHDPACLRACPSGAFEKRPDGVVLHRESLCLGCRYCQMACPFGAIRYRESHGIVGKCHLCHHRLDAGESPACVAACPTHALLLMDDDENPELFAELPGFLDPAGIRPRIRFRRPRRGLRKGRLERLLKQLLREGA